MAVKRKHRKKSIADINITPLVDVILVLLIIFMISSPMLTTGFDVSLPKASSTALNVENKQVIVNINRYGEVVIKGEKVKDLVKYLKDNNYSKQTQIIIDGDKRVKYESVISIMSSLNAAGYGGISLVTEDINK